MPICTEYQYPVDTVSNKRIAETTPWSTATLLGPSAQMRACNSAQSSRAPSTAYLGHPQPHTWDILKRTTIAHHPRRRKERCCTGNLRHCSNVGNGGWWNKKQVNGGVQLPHVVEFAYNNSVTAAMCLAPQNKAHMGSLPRLPFTVFEQPTSAATDTWTTTSSPTATFATERHQRLHSPLLGSITVYALTVLCVLDTLLL